MLFDDDENKTPGEAIGQALAVAYGTVGLLFVSFVVALAYFIYYVML